MSIRNPLPQEHPDQSECLHLVASAGTPRDARGKDWSRLTGYFRRFSLYVRKIGPLASTAAALEISDVRHTMEWIAHPAWRQREGIAGFAGQPLVHGQRILGVLAVSAWCGDPPRIAGWPWLFGVGCGGTARQTRHKRVIMSPR